MTTNQSSMAEFNADSSKTNELMGAAQEEARKAAYKGNQFLHSNPVPVIIGAFLVGTILGILFGQQNSKNDMLMTAREWLEEAKKQMTHKSPSTSFNRIAHKLKFW